MKRDLKALSDRQHDVVVVGGGIVGACVARDAARRGLSVALVEKGDFSGATSGGSSRLIHGGIRYLRSMQFGVVRDALRERRIWQKIAPHQVRYMPFLLPVRDYHPRGFFGLALTLYDALAFDRGQLPDKAERIPAHRWIDRAETIRRAPAVEGADLKGGYLYGDCFMRSPERIVLECLTDAHAHGAAVANYAAAEAILTSNGRIDGVRVTDMLAGDRFDVRAPLVVNAAGPWADDVIALAVGRNEQRIARSKGIHLIFPALTEGIAIAAAIKGGRYFFVVPYHGGSLVGTTDTPYTGDPGEAAVLETDVALLLENIAAGLPAANVGRRDILHAYAAVRPIIDEKGKASTSAMSRRAEVIDHGKTDGVPGLISAIGGKWTTARYIAEQAVDLLAARQGTKLRPCDTANALLPGAEADAAMPASGDAAPTAAEIAHAVREEMACRLDDVVFRRTGMGWLGSPGTEALAAAAEIMGSELGWTNEHRREEMARVTRRFATALPGGRP